MRLSISANNNINEDTLLLFSNGDTASAKEEVKILSSNTKLPITLSCPPFCPGNMNNLKYPMVIGTSWKNKSVIAINDNTVIKSMISNIVNYASLDSTDNYNLGLGISLTSDCTALGYETPLSGNCL